jgi:hypothetical protein
VNEVRELCGVSNKEDGGVVVDMVPVSLLSSEFERESTRITSSVGRSRFTTNSGESS